MSCARNGKLREPSEWCSTISVFPTPRRADRFRHQEVSSQLRPNFEDLKVVILLQATHASLFYHLENITTFIYLFKKWIAHVTGPCVRCKCSKSGGQIILIFPWRRWLQWNFFSSKMFHNCIKSQFYVEICKRFNKRNEMMNNNHFVLFYFSIYQI